MNVCVNTNNSAAVGHEIVEVNFVLPPLLTFAEEISELSLVTRSDLVIPLQTCWRGTGNLLISSFSLYIFWVL